MYLNPHFFGVLSFHELKTQPRIHREILERFKKDYSIYSIHFSLKSYEEAGYVISELIPREPKPVDQEVKMTHAYKLTRGGLTKKIEIERQTDGGLEGTLIAEPPTS